MASNWFPRRAVNLKQISFAYTPMSPTTTSRLLQLNYNWILFSCCFRGSFSSSFRPCQHRTFFETCVGLATQTEKSKIFAHRRAGEHKKKTHKHRPKVGQLQIFAYFCWSPVLLLVHCAVRHFQLFLSFAFEPWISNRRINDWGDFLRRCRSLHILLIGFRVFFFCFFVGFVRPLIYETAEGFHRNCKSASFEKQLKWFFCVATLCFSANPSFNLAFLVVRSFAMKVFWLLNIVSSTTAAQRTIDIKLIAENAS